MSVTDILKLGFSGFAFLVVYLSYQLEAKKPSPNKKAFARQGLILALLVVLSSFVDKVIARSDPSEMLSQCRSSLEQLSTFSKMPEADGPHLRKLIAVHVEPCEQILETLKVR